MVAAVVPNFTPVAAERLVPEMTTLVPPAFGPVDGVTPVTVGTPRYVNWSALDVVDVPPAVVTVTSTAPALPAGAVAVMEVAESAVIVPVEAPKLTAVAAVKWVPVMVTDVPPLLGPVVGLIPVTEGDPT
jgi:hypothetical protein